MRGEKTSPSKPKNGEFQTGSLENMENPHLSGPYIRTLVKKLATSKTGNQSPGNSETNSRVRDNDGNFESPDKNQSPERKRVRRRVQARKPHQEKLLNMAEARREIVAALKLHRAREKGHSWPEVQKFGPVPDQFSPDQETKLKSRRNPRIHTPDFTSGDKINCPVYYYSDNFTCSPGIYSPYHPWPVPQLAAPLFVQPNVDFTLPTQTLGLNLNLQDFSNLEISSAAGSSSILHSDSPLPASNFSPVAAVTAEEISPIGEDSIDLENHGPDQDFARSPFDAVVELPAWLNADCDNCLPDLNDFSGGAGGTEDADLPCMEIEEIEGMDGEWLA